jgi:hypothetical protein
MLEIQGFMDQITPSVDSIDVVWKSSAKDIRKMLAEVIAENNINHYTFYVKWMTNGIKSSLPFLANHPDTLNVRTDNRGFREVIDFLHQQGVKVGAAFQFGMFEPEAWGNDCIWGQWDLRAQAGITGIIVLADASSHVFSGRLWAMMAEYIRLFPETDYVFLESEGQIEERGLKTALQRWLAERGGPSVDKITYSAETVAYCKELNLPLACQWSEEGMKFAVEYRKNNYTVAQDALRCHGYRGEIGVFSHAWRVESRYIDQALPGNDWWIVPWFYFGWLKDAPEYASRLKACKEHLLEMKRRGFKVCYLGDATIANAYLPPIRELWELSRQHLDGYMAMGTPNTSLGLRWVGVTDAMVEDVRKLYREEIFPRKGGKR